MTTAKKHITVKGKKYVRVAIEPRFSARTTRARLVRQGYDVRFRLAKAVPDKYTRDFDEVAVYRSVKKVRKACPKHHHYSKKKRRCVRDRLYEDGYGGYAPWYELP